MAAILSVMFMGTGPPGAHFHSTGLVFLFSVKLILCGAFPTVWQSLRENMSTFTYSAVCCLLSNNNANDQHFPNEHCLALQAKQGHTKTRVTDLEQSTQLGQNFN